MPALAIVGSAVIGAGASYAAAKSQSKAIDRATAAQTQASDQQVQLAREQMDRAQTTLQPYVERGNRANSYLDALTYGQGAPPAAPAASPAAAPQVDWRNYYDQYLAGNATTQPDPFIAQMRAQGITDPAQIAQAHYQRWGQQLGNQLPYLAQPAPAASAAAGPVTRDDVLAQIAASAPYQYGEQEFNAQNGLTDQTYTGALGLADTEYADLADLAEKARTGRLSVADANLLQRLSNLDTEYSAWDTQQQDQRDRAVDAAFSRGGVTGLVGQTRAGVADIGQQYALAALLKRAELTSGAYDPYYADATGAENTYWTDLGDATALRGGRRQSAYDTSRAAYSTNQANRTASRQGAYADYVAGLHGDAGTGYSAASGQSSAGQTYANAASDAVGRSADAASNAALQRGQIQQQLYGDLAGIAGSAYGAITNRKKPAVSDPRTPSYY
jgi:hypothetical protein